MNGDPITFIISFIISSLIHIWPFLLISIVISTVIHLLDLSKHINKAFSKKPLVSIFLATLIGAVSPLCSCGVIPVISALLVSGVPLAPVMSFWLASPSMDPEVFFLSVSLVGWQLAIWRFVSTFVISLSAGYITHWMVGKHMLGDTFTKLLPKKTPCGCSCACQQKAAPPKTRLYKEIIKEVTKSTLFIVKFMIIAYLLEALIKLYIPDQLITSILGSTNHFAIEIATLIGIPLYTTNLSALGIVSGLLDQGMNPAAALSFLISGAMTTIPAMSAVYGITTKRVFLLYLAFSVIGSLLFGHLFQLLT